MDNKKELERAELHRTIWNIANDLRGSVDGWDFKQYVLGMLFYRYISENLANYINQGEIEAGYTDFRYENLSDEEAEQAREDMVSTKGFFILPSQLFCNVHKTAEHDENLNESLEKHSRNDNNVLFIDASKLCTKVTNSNKMEQKHINTILEAYTKRENQEYFCALVPSEKIAEENYNLSVSTYVEKEDTSEKINIIELNEEIKKIVAREQELREEIDKIIAEIEVE